MESWKRKRREEGETHIPELGESPGVGDVSNVEDRVGPVLLSHERGGCGG